MNEASIRKAFHRKNLLRQHKSSSTLIVDELGLNHGKVRADIAVLNSHYIGYEIKSDKDTLRRLIDQSNGYNSIFELIYLITTEKHLTYTKEIISDWWGVILANQGPRGAISFKTLKPPVKNPIRENIAITRLLWKNEALELLNSLGVQQKRLNNKREILYLEIANRLSTKELQVVVKEYLVKRQNWRDRTQPVQYDD